MVWGSRTTHPLSLSLTDRLDCVSVGKLIGVLGKQRRLPSVSKLNICANLCFFPFQEPLRREDSGGACGCFRGRKERKALRRGIPSIYLGALQQIRSISLRYRLCEIPGCAEFLEKLFL